jgi:serine acetyltransferase
VTRHPRIGDGVLIGAGSTLLGNITIGDRCNIGARSMVATDIPPNCVVVGVPARIIYQSPPEVGFPSRFSRSNPAVLMMQADDPDYVI